MLEQQSFFSDREQLLFHLQNYRVDKISHSKIDTLKQCPFKYYLIYIRRVEVPKAIFLEVGNGVHHKFEEFYEKCYKNADTFAKTWSKYLSGIVSGDFLPEKKKANLVVTEYKRISERTGKEFIIRIGNHIRMYGDPVNQFFKYLKKGKEFLKYYYEANVHKAPPVLIEQTVVFPIAIKSGKQFLMKSVLDRVDKTPEGFIYFDHKTDQDVPFQKELESKLQFTIYYLAIKALLGEFPYAMYYNHLMAGKVFPILREQRHIDELIAAIEQFDDAIRSMEFDPKTSRSCRWCDYSFNGVCAQYLKEYMSLKEELHRPSIIMPEGVQLRSLLTDQQWPEHVKKKPASRTKLKGETEDQQALFPRRKKAEMVGKSPIEIPQAIKQY
jgi:RecB family exonuclease